MPYELDQIDYRILRLLQQDATLSATEIAEQVGLSQSPCWRRIHRLQKHGYLRKKVAILARRKLGFSTVIFVDIKLSSHSHRSLEHFERAILELPEVLECWTISGRMDYTLRIVARDIESYQHFLRTKLLQLPQIQEARSHIAMSEIKSTHELPI